MWRNLIRVRNLHLDAIWLNMGVEIRLSVDKFIVNLGLWTTPIRITTTNRVSIFALSVTFHWCTKECSLKLFCCHSMDCWAYRLACVTIMSMTCSVIYSLKKSCAVGFLGRGTNNLSSPANFIFLGLNGSLDLFYSTATMELLTERIYWLIVPRSNLSLKVRVA